jgi:serine/threonine protein kinase
LLNGNRGKKILVQSMNRLFQNSTNNGRTGYELTSAAPNGSLRTVYNVTKGRKSIRPGMARLASGQQGVVFLASTDAAGKRKIIIKVSPTDKAFSSANQAARAEYNIQKALYKVAPRHIPKPIKFFEQNLFVPVSAFTSRRTNIFNYSKQMVMYTEYAHGGTLKSWLRKMGDRITDKVMADLIRQVIGTLKTIHTKYPEFRHNDLHLGNILVDDTGKKVRFLLTDFGLSRLTKHGSNPAINSGSYRNSGISNLTSSKYDTHYFLNALDSEIKGGLPQTKAFLGRMLTGSYRGANTNKVSAYRLKNGASNAGLPSFTEILRDPFLSGKPNRGVRSTPVVSPSIGAIFNTATPNANAADIASRALANIPGVRVTRPSAAEFARMSPRSRSAFFTRTRAHNASRSVVVRNVARTRGANVVRETLRRVPGAPVSRLPLGTGSRLTRAGATMTREEIEAVLGPSSRSPISNRPTSVRRASPRSAAAGRHVPIPAMTARERTGIARGMRNARRAARVETRARAGPRASSGPRLTPKQILNKYVNNMNNLRTLTRRVLKKKLTNSGVAAANANRHARNWEANWLTTRTSANHAVRNLKKGKNITKRAYSENVLPVAHRRHAENLSKGNNGRVRKGKTLLSGKKKPELVAMARRHGITGANSMTKDMIITALYG